MDNKLMGLLHQRIACRMVHLSCALVLLFSMTACAGQVAQADQPVRDKITIGMDNTAVNTLILIAQDQNFFNANGLDVTIKTYASGLAATNDMLDKQTVNVATTSEYVLVGKALAGQKVVALGSIDKFMHNYLIARKDRGVSTVADLQGKTIGVPLMTAAEFYLGRLLELHGLSLNQVKLVNLDPADTLNALSRGLVDAVVAWEPNAKTIEDRLGDGIVKWPAQNEQVTYAVLLSSPAWTKSHQDIVRRLIRSLAQAETWFASHLEETKALLKKRLSYDDAYIAVIWPEHHFQLSLDQSLVLAMEDESRWMIRNRMTTASETPPLLDYLDVSGIQAVLPDAVNIIR